MPVAVAFMQAPGHEMLESQAAAAAPTLAEIPIWNAQWAMQKLDKAD